MGIWYKWIIVVCIMCVLGCITSSCQQAITIGSPLVYHKFTTTPRFSNPNIMITLTPTATSTRYNATLGPYPTKPTRINTPGYRPPPTTEFIDVASTPNTNSSPKLCIPGSSAVPVCVNEMVFDELIKAAIVGDQLGYLELQLIGGIFEVNNNTRVLVIDSGWRSGCGIRKVRILEGEWIGKAGWVRKEWVIN